MYRRADARTSAMASDCNDVANRQCLAIDGDSARLGRDLRFQVADLLVRLEWFPAQVLTVQYQP